MSKPSISLYLPFRNYSLYYLKEALHSIKEQSFQDFEFIFVCYGQKDLEGMLNALSIIEFPYKFYYRPNLRNFIEAVDFAMSKCEGKYILRIDSDDIMKPEALQELYDEIERTGDSAVIPNHDLIDNESIIYKLNRKGNSLDFPLPTVAIINREHAKCIRFMPHQQFRDKLNLIYCFEENNYKIGFLDKSLFYYRVHPDSISHGRIPNEELTSHENKIKEYFGRTEDIRIPNH